LQSLFQSPQQKPKRLRLIPIIILNNNDNASRQLDFITNTTSAATTTNDKNNQSYTLNLQKQKKNFSTTKISTLINSNHDFQNQ